MARIAEEALIPRSFLQYDLLMSSLLRRARWQGKTVAVTGAAGFLGSHLVLCLLDAGAEVVGVSRQQRIESTGPGFSWVRADLANLEQARRVFASRRFDCVYHLSSLANGRTSIDLVAPTLQAELVATVHVLIAAAEQKVARLVLPSSLEEPSAGDAPLSPYAAAKAASRLYARMFECQYAVPIVTARVLMAYGPGQPHWKLIPCIGRALLRGESPRVMSPDRAVDLIYVSDVIEGLLAVGEAEICASAGRTFELGSGELLPIRDIVALMSEISGSPAEPHFATALDRQGERVVKADLTAAQTLGWKPAISLREGLALTLEWLKQTEPAANA